MSCETSLKRPILQISRRDTGQEGFKRRRDPILIEVEEICPNAYILSTKDHRIPLMTIDRVSLFKIIHLLLLSFLVGQSNPLRPFALMCLFSSSIPLHSFSNTREEFELLLFFRASFILIVVLLRLVMISKVYGVRHKEFINKDLSRLSFTKLTLTI